MRNKSQQSLSNDMKREIKSEGQETTDRLRAALDGAWGRVKTQLGDGFAPWLLYGSPVNGLDDTFVATADPLTSVRRKARD